MQRKVAGAAWDTQAPEVDRRGQRLRQPTLKEAVAPAGNTVGYPSRKWEGRKRRRGYPSGSGDLIAYKER